MKRFLIHARLCAAQAFDGGLFYVASGYVLRLLRLVFLLFLWRSALTGREESFSVDQVLAYTLFSSLFAQQLDVRTSASEDLWKGFSCMRYLRPASVQGQIVAETVGRWLPGLLCYSIPAFVLALFMGVPAAPLTAAHGLLALLSLLLCLTLGFCIDSLFLSLAAAMPNAMYQAGQIRSALTVLCSGALIPFTVLPFGLGDVLALLPIGSLAGAPLSVYSGLAPLGKTLLLQLFWNLALWPCALYFGKKSEERLVSYGG